MIFWLVVYLLVFLRVVFDKGKIYRLDFGILEEPGTVTEAVIFFKGDPPEADLIPAAIAMFIVTSFAGTPSGSDAKNAVRLSSLKPAVTV